MKRFSWIGFVTATLVHLYGASLLFDAGIRDAHASQRGEPDHPLLLAAASWIWEAVPMLLKPLFKHHGAVSHEWPLKPAFRWDIFVALSWSFVVGTCVGFIIPGLFRWTSNRLTNRFLAVQGYGISVPGLPDDGQLRIADSDKFRMIQGTTDFVVGEKHRELIQIAHRYAERYNSYLWASGTLSV